MADLSHWDFAEQFKAKEAAELIMGIPPEKNDGRGSLEPERVLFTQKITPVLRRMERAYRSAGDTLSAAASWRGPDNARESLDRFPMIPEELHSELMVRTREHPLSFSLSLFGHDRELSLFDAVYFSRDEIDRWLKAIGMQSVYRFNRSDLFNQTSPTSELDKPGGWPWGRHHTVLLGHLDAAARRYWGNRYDPSDATTASTNATVSEWLHKERKVSRTMADSIASMLRPDGLPTGPRK